MSVVCDICHDEVDDKKIEIHMDAANGEIETHKVFCSMQCLAVWAASFFVSGAAKRMGFGAFVVIDDTKLTHWLVFTDKNDFDDWLDKSQNLVNCSHCGKEVFRYLAVEKED